LRTGVSSWLDTHLGQQIQAAEFDGETIPPENICAWQLTDSCQARTIRLYEQKSFCRTLKLSA
jgi:hypothetical protein